MAREGVLAMATGKGCLDTGAKRTCGVWTEQTRMLFASWWSKLWVTAGILGSWIDHCMSVLSGFVLRWGGHSFRIQLIRGRLAQAYRGVLL